MPAPISQILVKRLAVMCCVVLLALFAILAWSSSTEESATTDEPMHLMGAYVRVNYADFRVDRENPPLFGYFAMLAHPHGGLSIDTSSNLWRQMPGQMWYSNPWAVAMLYQVPGNDGDRFVQSSRAMMLILGVALGAVICIWAYSLAGSLAAVFTAVLFCLDPNFLAHAPIIKNDVPLALTMTALSLALWRMGKRVTIWNLLGVCAACAAGANVKFSGLVFIGFVVVVVIARALSPVAWPVLNRSAQTRAARLLLACSIALGAVLATFVLTWACYGFRFAPTPDPRVRFDIDGSTMLVRRYVAMAANNGQPPSAAQVQETPEPLTVRAIRFAERHRLMPQAWYAGMIYIYATTIARPAYLLGNYSWNGWWYYFPLACLFKTPIATLLAGAAAAGWACMRAPWKNPSTRWALACLLIPAGLYALFAVTSHVNAGLRHILPIYPACYVACGVIAAKAWRLRRARLLIVSLVGVLALETLGAYPNYIPIFNVAAGGFRGGAKLLGDSNLDWGQDLKRLVTWQQAHSNVDLSVAYVGSVDPRFYGLRYTPLIGNSNPPGEVPPPARPGVMAVSVSLIQGMYGQPERNAVYAPLRNREPMEILGGSIYLYRLPLQSD
jgi:hypothetical protein